MRKLKMGFHLKFKYFFFLWFFFFFHSRRPFLIYLPFCCVGMAKFVGFGAVHNAVYLKWSIIYFLCLQELFFTVLWWLLLDSVSSVLSGFLEEGAGFYLIPVSDKWKYLFIVKTGKRNPNFYNDIISIQCALSSSRSPKTAGFSMAFESWCAHTCIWYSRDIFR